MARLKLKIRTTSESAPPQPTEDSLAPIARWDVVPYQRIAQGTTFKIGVVAFSKAGIWGVRFTVGSLSYVDVKTMSLNDRTGVWEYWTTVTCADHPAGVLTINATVYGSDGGYRTLSPLKLMADSDGSVPQPEAWVDVNGNDSTGKVNDNSQPFKTIAQAAYKIMVWQEEQGYGRNTSGGIIRLNQGTHEWDNGGHWTTDYPPGNEWLTLTTAAGGTPENTILQRTNDEGFGVDRLRVTGIKMQVSNTSYPPIAMGSVTRDSYLWIDNVVAVAQDKFANRSILANGADRQWCTDTTITGFYRAFNNSIDFVRGVTITDSGYTPLVNPQFVVNTTIDSLDPYPKTDHINAVAWSTPEKSWENLILYNLKATNLHYSGFALFRGVGWDNTLFDDRNLAIVNCYLELADPIRYDGANGGFLMLWLGEVDHLVFWHNTFRYEGVESSVAVEIYKHPKETIAEISNSSFRGNMFNAMYSSSEPELTFPDTMISDNHFVHSTPVSQFEQLSMNSTFGDAELDSEGVPMPGSPLLDRIAPPLVPADAIATPRIAPDTVGAYFASY